MAKRARLVACEWPAAGPGRLCFASDGRFFVVGRLDPLPSELSDVEASALDAVIAWGRCLNGPLPDGWVRVDDAGCVFH